MKLDSVPILMPGSPLFENLLDLADRPLLRCGNHANQSVVSHRDERMRADLLLNLFDTDVSVRPQCRVISKSPRKVFHFSNHQPGDFPNETGFSLGRLLFKVL